MTGSDANIRSSHNNTAENGVSAAVASVANGRLCFLDDFLIARGGPYYDLQKRLGLLTERALNAGRRAAILVGLAWGVPLVCPSSSLPGMPSARELVGQGGVADDRACRRHHPCYGRRPLVTLPGHSRAGRLDADWERLGVGYRDLVAHFERLDEVPHPGVLHGDRLATPQSPTWLMDVRCGCDSIAGRDARRGRDRRISRRPCRCSTAAHAG